MMETATVMTPPMKSTAVIVTDFSLNQCGAFTGVTSKSPPLA